MKLGIPSAKEMLASKAVLRHEKSGSDANGSQGCLAKIKSRWIGNIIPDGRHPLPGKFGLAFAR